jgi:hypothetical protein
MSYGQHIGLSSIEKRMDSLAIYNRIKFVEPVVDDSIKTFRISDWVKISIKTSINTTVFNKLDSKEITLGDLESDDYFSIGKFNFRFKLYLTKKIRFISEMMVNGVDVNKYSYNSGLILKF